MSRCFPFPPPGYENKALADDLNVIIKENHKHKTHKDKKDKDKKERSERKDKEKTKGKHKEDKKDRKQKKHRDKKDKKKEKQKSSDQKIKTVGPSENQNEKLSPDNNRPGNGANNYRVSVELGKRVREDDEATDKKDKKKEKQIVGSLENQNGEKPGPDNKKPGDGAHDYRMSVELGKRIRNDDAATDKNDKKKEKKTVGSSENHNGEKLGPVNNKPGNGIHDYRISVELGKKVRNDDEAADKKKEKQIIGSSENRNGEKLGPYKNKPGDEAHDYRILVEMGKRVRNDDGARDNSCVTLANGQSLGVDAKGLGNNWVGNFSGEKRIKVDKNGSCQANMEEKRKEDKETNGLGVSVGEGDGLNNENRHKSKKEDKKRKKEEKKEKVKERSKEKINQRVKSDSNLLESCANKPDDLLKEIGDPQGKLPKLKEPVSNGFLHENGTRPDNTPRPVIHQVSQNGSGSHPSQNNTIPSTTEKQAVITNQKVNGKLSSSQSVLKIVQIMEPGPTAGNATPDHTRTHMNNHAVCNDSVPSHPLVENGRKTDKPNSIDETVDGPRPVFAREMDSKDHGINGVLKGKKNISSRPSSVSVKPKAPHPDLKYLSQVLVVPKVELPQFDDQEWLLGCKDAERPKFGSSEIVECAKVVWAEAIQLDSVTALPYVVPY